MIARYLDNLLVTAGKNMVIILVTAIQTSEIVSKKTRAIIQTFIKW